MVKDVTETLKEAISEFNKILAEEKARFERLFREYTETNTSKQIEGHGERKKIMRASADKVIFLERVASVIENMIAGIDDLLLNAHKIDDMELDALLRLQQTNLLEMYSDAMIKLF